MSSRRTVLALVAALALLLLGAGPSAAHGDLTDGSPGPGDEVVPGVAVLRLDLAEVDPEEPLSVALTDDAGEPAPVGEAAVVDGDHVCAASAPLTEGVWTLDYAGTGVDGHRFGSRYAFEVTAAGEQADAGVCAGADLADPPPAAEAQTIAEMTEGDAGVPAWVVWGMVALACLAAAGVVVRVRRDRAYAPDDD